MASGVKQRILACAASIAFATALGLQASSAQDPDRSPFDKSVRVAENLEPAIPWPDQDRIARDKMQALRTKAGRPPNILIFLVDDMGWGDVGVNGGGAAVGAATPNIDRLAHQGLNLTSTYTQPTCTPARAAFMTGRLPARTGLTRPLLAGDKPTVNPWEGESTAAGLLSEAGYRTAITGKWHVGELKGTRPTEVGYDEFLGILSVVSEFTQHFDQRLYPDMVLRPDRLRALRSLSEPQVVASEKGREQRVVQEIKSPDDASKMDQMFADFSVDFIKKNTAANKPFYLVHSFSRIHNDNFPAPGYAGKSAAGFPVKDAIVEVDDIVGRVMQTLRETGQLENTFVFFTSDNGGNEDTWPDSGYQPWRGGKGSTWEGGVRVPGIAYWPSMISPGQSNDGLFDLMDLFTTSLAIAGEQKRIPTNRYIDGIDQLGFLLSDKGKSARQCVFMYSETNLMALRWMEYKAHFQTFQGPEPRKNLDQSYVVTSKPSPWIYNLYLDPKEQVSSGHRFFEWGLPQLVYFAGRHAATFKKYPMKSVGLEMPG
jgi:arylsulfatase